MSTTPRSLSLAVLIVALAACSAGTAGGPTSNPAPTPTAVGASGASGAPSGTPDFGAIDHPSGPTDIVLQVEDGGGFVMAGFRAAEAPIFTLYGDGTIIFRNPMLDPLPSVGAVMPLHPFRTAKLTESQIQDLLAYALGEGGLGIARPDYPNNQISDASTTVFTLNAGGLTKTVSIYALGLELDGMADGQARAAFARLSERLRTIDANGAIATSEFVPERYRGALFEGQPGAPDARPWPWTEIAPKDFIVDADPNGLQMPVRILTAADVEALGIDPFVGGFLGVTLIGPDDGRVYSFSLRPLLPGE
jgi:hypothetical protein